jgi:hypothetical protein
MHKQKLQVDIEDLIIVKMLDSQKDLVSLKLVKKALYLKLKAHLPRLIHISDVIFIT